MRGKFLVGFGLLLIILGSIALFRGYSDQNPAWIAIAWAFIIGGTLALLGGLARKVSDFLSYKPDNNSHYGPAEIRTLIQSMGEMAAADGIIDPREIETIADIHEKMLGIKITDHEVSKILNEFNEKDNIRDQLDADQKMVNPAMKRMIIQSCYLVMMSDGDKNPAELTRLYEIGDVLGISRNEVEHLISIAGN